MKVGDFEQGKFFFQSALPLIFLVLIFYINFSSRIIVAPLLPLIKEKMGISSSQAGSIFFFITIGYFFSFTLSGFLSAKISHRRTIVFSACAIAVCLIMMAFADSFVQFSLAVFLLGSASGLYLPSGIVTITRSYPARHWGKVIAVHELAPNIATLTAPFVVAMTVEFFSVRDVLISAAVIALFAGFSFNRSVSGRDDILGTTPAFKTCKRLFLQKIFWIIVFLFSLAITTALGLYSMLPLFLVSEHGMSEVAATSLVGGARVSTLFMALAGGWLADRIGSFITMGAALFFSGIFSACIGITEQPWIDLMVMLQPVLAVTFFPAAFTLITRLCMDVSGDLVISMVVPSAYLVGGGLVPALMGYFADLGFFRHCFVVSGVIVASGVFPVFWLWKHTMKIKSDNGENIC